MIAKKTEGTRKMIRWTKEEMFGLAEIMVDELLRDPLGVTPLMALKKAQEALDTDRRRTINTFATAPEMKSAFLDSWTKRTAGKIREEAPKVVGEEPEAPMPQIIFIEIPMPIKLKDIEAVGLAAIKAAEVNLLAKEAQQRHQDTINALAGRAVTVTQPVAIPHPVVIGEERKRNKRVGIGGLFQKQFQHLMDAFEEAGIHGVELVFLENNNRASAVVDYAILTRHHAQGLKTTMSSQLGREHLFALPSSGVDTILRQIRDIASRQKAA